MAVSQITLPLEECQKIQLHEEDDDDDWMEAAFTFYKGRGFDKKAGVRISIRGQPAVDTGGIRRQFFSVVFTKLASESTGIFDGLLTDYNLLTKLLCLLQEYSVQLAP